MRPRTPFLARSFFERPNLNSPCEYPFAHWDPKTTSPEKRKAAEQAEMVLDEARVPTEKLPTVRENRNRPDCHEGYESPRDVVMKVFRAE